MSVKASMRILLCAWLLQACSATLIQAIKSEPIALAEPTLLASVEATAVPTAGLHTWEVNDVQEVDAFDPKLKRERAISIFHSPFIGELPTGYQLLYRSMALVPQFRNMIRLLRYQF